MRIHKAVLWAFLLVTIMFPADSRNALAADITFDSFEAAEAAAKKRAEEYQKKMQEHINNVNEQWEKQQKDLGADASSPDISKITTRQDGSRSSDTDASKSLENAVNSSINRLKDEMVSKAGPTSTGFAGGSAGYQWSVKFKDGKYVLSDSYNEAEFNTGKKKEVEAPAPAPAEPEDVAAGNDDDSDTGSETVTAAEPTKTAAAPSGSTPAATAPTPSPTPATPPADGEPAAAPTTTATKPAAPEEPAKPLTGVDPAPVKLPPPSIRMVIQHPTDFSEEVFASNANSETTANYRLDKFKIPEDTRIKIAVEVGEDVSPEDVTMVVTDDQGDSSPVSATKLKNYRHMFRVPSDDQYSASVYVNNRKAPGGQQKKILQVAIPVGKVDFESRTIDNQRGSRSGSGNMSSSDTSSSGGNESINHSSFGKPQAVDLSDLYAEPSLVGTNAAGSSSGSTAGSNSAGSASSSGSGSESASEDADNAGGQSYTDTGASTGNNNSGESSTAGSMQGAGADGSENGDASSQATGADEAATGGDSSISSGSDSGASSASDGSQHASASGAGYTDSDSDDSGQSTGDAADAVTGTAENGADESTTAETAGNSAGEGAGTDATGDNQSNKAPGQNVAGNKTGATGKEQNSEEEDPFLLAISLRAEAQKVYQSFDFIDGNTQTSSAIKAGGEVVFSLNMGNDVNPESIQIRLSDGDQEIKGNLKRMGESFAYVFKSPTDSAYIEVSGKTSRRSFTYKVGIPVK